MPARESRATIAEWSVGNFKSIKSATVVLRPLTVLVGPNSSGKSSLLQSILLFVQASRSWREGETIRLNGPLVSLGEFDDVLSSDAEEKGVLAFGGVFDLDRDRGISGRRVPVEDTEETGGALGWSVELCRPEDDSVGVGHVQRATLHASDVLSVTAEVGERVRDQSADSTPVDWRGRQYQRVTGYINVEGRRLAFEGLDSKAGVPTGAAVEQPVAQMRVRMWLRRVLEYLVDDAVDAERSSRQPSRRSVASVWYRSQMHLFEDQTVLGFENDRAGEGADILSHADQFEISTPAFDRLREGFVEYLGRKRERGRPPGQAAREYAQELSQHFSESERRQIVDTLLGDDSELLVRYLASATGEDENTWVALDLQGSTPEVFRRGEELVSFLQQRVTYLGPLREAPQAMYRAAYLEQPDDIGIRGENVAAVLLRHGDEGVLAPLPSGGTRMTSLERATTEWLRFFDLAESVGLDDRGRQGLVMEVEVSGLEKPVDMTSVGVGLSQVLPVIVRVLLAAPGSVVLLEQPELHLHPGLQQKLGEFLVRASESGRQIIVETHSDHMVSRLRRLIAEDHGSSTRDLVGLVHVWREHGETVFKSVDVNRYGGIDEWPPGFFDQTATEARSILRAGLDKRQREAEESRNSG